jgi:hypothetical protein
MAYGSVTYALAVKQDGLIIVSSLLLTGVILYGLLVYVKKSDNAACYRW